MHIKDHITKSFHQISLKIFASAPCHPWCIALLSKLMPWWNAVLDRIVLTSRHVWMARVQYSYLLPLDITCIRYMSSETHTHRALLICTYSNNPWHWCLTRPRIIWLNHMQKSETSLLMYLRDLPWWGWLYDGSFKLILHSPTTTQDSSPIADTVGRLGMW